MQFDVLTIFPEYFDSPLKVGLISKALDAGKLKIGIHDLRKWAPDPRKVDDQTFGGGPGMVMSAEPLVAAIREIADPGALIISLTPAGKSFNQSIAREIAAEFEQIVLVCGRYEGIDARVADIVGAIEYSVGDFVLTGGEVAALCVIEAIGRLVPEYLGNDASLDEESFSSGLLEYPHYTRPAEFEGHKVPEVLTSGDHGRVARWRREQSLRRTLARRPDLLEKATLTDEERRLIEQWKREIEPE